MKLRMLCGTGRRGNLLLRLTFRSCVEVRDQPHGINSREGHRLSRSANLRLLLMIGTWFSGSRLLGTEDWDQDTVSSTAGLCAGYSGANEGGRFVRQPQLHAVVSIIQRESRKELSLTKNLEKAMQLARGSLWAAMHDDP